MPFSVGVCVCVFECLHPCAPVAALMSGPLCVCTRAHVCGEPWLIDLGEHFMPAVGCR